MARMTAIRWGAVAGSLINLGIHLALTPDHLIEKRYIGVLFVIGSALLGLVVIGLSTDRDRPRTLAWLLGAAVNAAMLVAFVLSRTTGLPQGYREPWASAPEDLLGLACVALEVVFLLCAAASLRPSRPAEVVPAGATPPPAGWRLPVHDRTAPLT